MSRKDMKIVYQFLDGSTGRRSESMCSTVGELAETMAVDYKKAQADENAERLEFYKTQFVLILTEGEESEVDRVSRCPLITFESFVRINEFVE